MGPGSASFRRRPQPAPPFPSVPRLEPPPVPPGTEADGLLARVEESARLEIQRLQDLSAAAVRLLEEALHLRMNGERAPGGSETWADWDRRAEIFLRAPDG